MISLSFIAFSSSATLPIGLKPSLTQLQDSSISSKFLKSSFHHKKLSKKKIRRGSCRAEFSVDAPFAVAIGGCMLNSLVFPITGPDDDSKSAIDSTDARFAVMGIISFIPYFNWLSWVFAWLDSGKRRYAVYSFVYLAPYLRSNLSLSPEDSWLPIASIALCIIHVQLEASIRNGDLEAFQLFNKAARHLSSTTREEDINLKRHQRNTEEENKGEQMNLPSAEEELRNDIRSRGVLKKPIKDSEHLDGGWNDEETTKH